MGELSGCRRDPVLSAFDLGFFDGERQLRTWTVLLHQSLGREEARSGRRQGPEASARVLQGSATSRTARCRRDALLCPGRMRRVGEG